MTSTGPADRPAKQLLGVEAGRDHSQDSSRGQFRRHPRSPTSAISPFALERQASFPLRPTVYCISAAGRSVAGFQKADRLPILNISDSRPSSGNDGEKGISRQVSAEARHCPQSALYDHVKQDHGSIRQVTGAFAPELFLNPLATRKDRSAKSRQILQVSQTCFGGDPRTGYSVRQSATLRGRRVFEA